MKRRVFVKNTTLGGGAFFLSSQISKIFAATDLNGEKPFSAEKPCVMNISQDCAWIVWSTSENSIACVEVSSKEDSKFQTSIKIFDSANGVKVVDTLHCVKLIGLSSGKRYKIRAHSMQVLSEAEGGALKTRKKLVSPEIEFAAADLSKEKIKFLVINDMHEDTGKLSELLAHSKGMDFTLFNGDMVNYMRSRNQMLRTFFTPASLNTHAPVYYSRGNHEARGAYADNFMEFSPTPTGFPYFAFRQGPAFFIVLDAGEDKPDGAKEYFDTANFDEFRLRQGAWMKEITKTDDYKNASKRVIVVHIPPFLKSMNWRGAVHFSEVLFESMKGEKIDLILSGHLHRFLVEKASPETLNAPIAVCSNEDAFRVEISKDKIDIVRVSRSGKETPVNLSGS